MFCWNYLGQCDAVNFLKWASIKLLCYEDNNNHTQNDNNCNQSKNYKSFMPEKYYYYGQACKCLNTNYVIQYAVRKLCMLHIK